MEDNTKNKTLNTVIKKILNSYDKELDVLEADLAREKLKNQDEQK